jgi:hypothetical protein
MNYADVPPKFPAGARVDSVSALRCRLSASYNSGTKVAGNAIVADHRTKVRVQSLLILRFRRAHLCSGPRLSADLAHGPEFLTLRHCGGKSLEFAPADR